MLSSGNICQEIDCSGIYGQLKPLNLGCPYLLLTRQTLVEEMRKVAKLKVVTRWSCALMGHPRRNCSSQRLS